MKTYVALLRGINVGGNNKVSMKELKELFVSLGFTNVSTYINSGNVIFQSKNNASKDITKIETKLEKMFGFPIRIVIRDGKNINLVVNEIPKEWYNDVNSKTDVLFLWDEYAKEDTLNLIIKNPKVDKLKYVDGAIIWNIDRKMYNKSGMKKFIGTTVYKNMTARNVNTVRRLAELMNEK